METVPHAPDPREYAKVLRIAPNGELITLAEKTILLLLADYMNRKKGYAWPSFSTLAECSTLSRRHVIRVLASLERKGILQVDPEWKPNGSQASNQYRFVELLPDERPAKEPRSSTERRRKTPRTLREAPESAGMLEDSVGWGSDITMSLPSATTSLPSDTRCHHPSDIAMSPKRRENASERLIRSAGTGGGVGEPIPGTSAQFAANPRISRKRLEAQRTGDEPPSVPQGGDAAQAPHPPERREGAEAPYEDEVPEHLRPLHRTLVFVSGYRPDVHLWAALTRRHPHADWAALAPGIADRYRAIVMGVPGQREPNPAIGGDWRLILDLAGEAVAAQPETPRELRAVDAA